MRIIFLLKVSFYFILFQSNAQTIEYFDSKWNPCVKVGASFYREITYDENGKPLGKVKDYWVTGELQFEGQLLSSNPDSLDGVCTWYYRNGFKKKEALFKNGEISSSLREWKNNGQKEGTLDESRRFYSKDYLNEQLIDFSFIIQTELKIDTSSVAFFQYLGVSMEKEGLFEVSISFFKLAHDLSIILQDKTGLALSYNNIGSTYSAQGYWSKALGWHQKAIKIRKKLNLEADLATSYNNIGSVYSNTGQLKEALKTYQKAIKIRKKLNLKADLATSYNHIGGVYSSLGQLKKALKWYHKAKEIREQLDLKNDLAVSYNNIGTIYHKQGQLEAALIWYYKAKEIEEALDIKISLATSYNNIGVIYSDKGQIEQARDWYYKAIDIQEGLSLEVDLVTSYNNVGAICIALGQWEKALKWFHKSIDIAKKLRMDVELSTAYHNMSHVYSSQGEREAAIEWCCKAIKILEPIGTNIKLARSYNNIGGIYSSLGKFDEALKWYHQAGEIKKQLGMDNELATYYNNIGEIYYQQEKMKEALIWHKKAQVIREKLNLETDLATTYNNIGCIYNSQNQNRIALKWHKKAQAIGEKLHLETNLATTYNNIAAVYWSEKELKKSLKWLKKSKNIQESLSQEVDLSNSYNNIGKLYKLLGKSEEALNWCKKSKAIREKLSLEPELVASYKDLSFLFFTLNKFDSTLNYVQKNIQLNEKLRGLNKGKVNRHIYINRSLNVIEVGVISAYQLNKFEYAFSLLEKGKSRGLLDLLIDRSIDFSEFQIPLKDSYKNATSQLTSLNQNLSQKISNIKRKKILELRDSVFSKRQELEDQLRITVPEYSNLVFPETVNKEKVQTILQEDEILVSFYAGELNSYALLVSHTQLEMIDLGDPDSLSYLVNTFQNSFIKKQKAALLKKDIRLGSKLKNTFFEQSNQLYQKLWKPLEDTGLLENKKIIIVPDGFLHYLPFELLIKDQEQKEYTDYHYLIKDYSISYASSATILHFERTKDVKGKKTQKDFFGLALEDFKNNHCYETKTDFTNLYQSLPALNSISNLFAKDKRYTITGQVASEENIKTIDLNQYRYLHFSTHGIINAEKPDFSRILLSPSEKDDGCLNLYEIFELDLNADLVSLSACETGLGQLVRGEGMVGFTRALMYAGTPSMILSLWKVPDESTSDLFVNYYSKLQKNNGTNKYAPLREVQLEMIQSEKYSNPYYWAPFIFIGEKSSQ